MKVVSVCPLRAMGLVYATSTGASAETIIVKATFILAPLESVLAADQDELNEDDNHWNDDPTRSVYAPSDRAPFKPKADVMLVGHAFAPRGEPTRSLIARVAVGEVDKSIEVCCDRGLRPADGQRFETQGFVKMPLRWERAAGGPETENPVGINLNAPPDKYGVIAIPNLQPPGTFVSQTSDTFPPMCFGPIAERWPARVSKFGHYAGALTTRDWNARPLPDYLDYECFHAAPADQRTSEIRPNERIILENLHPEHARLVTSLPGIQPQAIVERASGERESVVLVADTLWIDTDRGYCTVVWRGRIGLRHADEAGQITVSMSGGASDSTAAPLGTGVHEVGGSRPSTAPPPAGKPEESTSMLTIAELAPNRNAASPMPFQGGGVPKSPPSSSGHGGRGLGTALPFMRDTAPRSPMARPSRDEASYAVKTSNGAVKDDIPMAAASDPILPPAPALSPPPMVKPAAESRPGAAQVSVSPWAGGAKDLVVAAPAIPFVSQIVLDMSPASSVSPVVPKVPFSPPAPSIASSMSPPSINSLIWYHDESVSRFRRVSAWKGLLKELERKPKDKDLDDPALAKDPMEMEERREVFEILTHGSAINAEAVQQAYLDAIREDGKFVPPIVLVEGEIAFPFDELETLKATMTTVSPLATPSDENLRASLDAAKEFLKTPGLSSAPAVSEGLTTRIKDSFGQGRRSVPSGYVETQSERVLLEQRHYQKRAIFGGKFLRALLSPPGSSSPMPTYLPEDVSPKLPMYQRFRVRLIVEVNQQEDQYESQSLALRVLALSRVTPPPKR